MIDTNKMRGDLLSDKGMVLKSLSAGAGFEQKRLEDTFSADFAEEMACYLQEEMYRRDRNKVTNSLLYDAYMVIEACRGQADPYKIKAILATYWGYPIPT